jgi:heme exporter protein B
MNLLAYIIAHEFRLARKSGSDFFSTISFFLVVISISSFLLKSVLWIGPSLALCMCWIVCMTSYIISIEKFFSRDLEDGSLEFYLSLPRGSFIIFLGKMISHWLLNGLPLTFFSFFLYLFYVVPSHLFVILPITIGFGTLLLSMLAFLGYSLTYRLKYRGSILSVLLLPLYFPILLLNVNLIEIYSESNNLMSPIQIYIGISIFFLALTSSLSYYALRYSIE